MTGKPVKPRKSLKRATALRVMARDCYACVKCVSRDRLEIHHKVEVQVDGPDDIDNLIVLCHECHKEWTHSDHFMDEFESWLWKPPMYLIKYAMRHQGPAVAALLAQQWLAVWTTRARVAIREAEEKDKVAA